MDHPSLGRPPRDLTAGRPAAADRLRAARSRIAGRAIEIAVEGDPTMPERHGELGLRKLLRDTNVMLDQLALAVASGDPSVMKDYGEWVAPIYRRRRVPMDDVIRLAEALRRAVGSVMVPDEQPTADAALDVVIAAFRAHRRLAGDARKRNPILSFLYKGA
ncbi:MAG TPA: hypothetical protein VH813_05745 [Candidatus Limnocylindrales bacterium]|jgi:hypothetical protein